MAEMNELNKKLAEWAGFEQLSFGEHVKTWVFPDGSKCNDGKVLSIDFPNDLNACFKWLVPKVLEEYNIESYWFKQHDDWYYSETNIWRKGSTKHGLEVLHDEHIAKDFEQGTDLEKITALALCKAIEKLIDAEKQ